jgi:hypothetical protein
MQTMVNDIRTEMKIRWWKSHELYQPISDGRGEGTKFKRDRQGDGPAGPSRIRMLGVPRRCCEDTYTVEAVAKLLEELLIGDSPFGQWPEELLGEWINDVHVTQFEELGVHLHSYVSLTKDTFPRLETIWNVSGEIDNSFFTIRLPRSDSDLVSFVAQIDWEAVNRVQEFATPAQHLITDHEFRSFCCQVSTYQLCVQVCVVLD